MALLFELLPQQHAHRHGTGVVDLCAFNSLFLVLPQFFGIPQGAEGNDGKINIAVGKGGVNDLRV